jgi:hypothetical protein
MVFKTSLRWLSLLLVLGVLTVGCSDEVGTPSSAEDGDFSDLELEDPTGGYTSTDEPELASDPSLGGFADADGMVDDPVADDPEVAAALDGAPSFNLYFVRLVWGVLPQEDTGGSTDLSRGPEVDWSGALEVTGGSIVALRTILFERNDFIVRPREDPKLLEFASGIDGHYDGLLIAVAIPSDEDDGTNTLSFTTEPFEQSWTFAELDSLNQIYDTKVPEHEVSVISTRRQPGACTMGFVMGRWRGDLAGRGRFEGVWMSFDGSAMGFLRGHYGRTHEGHNVLHGKYFNSEGEFLGFIRGGYAGRRPHAGVFRAIWLDEEETEDGFMKGHWVHIPRTHRGFFQGRWGTNCLGDGEGGGDGNGDGSGGTP